MSSYLAEVAALSTGKQNASSLTAPIGLLNPLSVGDVVTVEVGIVGTATIFSVEDSVGNIYIRQASNNNGTTGRTELWVSVITTSLDNKNSLTVSLSTSAAFAFIAEAYTGVVHLGATAVASGFGSDPNISLITQDANNIVVVSFAWFGNNTVLAVGPSPVGVLRNSSKSTGHGTEAGVACNDNMSSIAGNVSNTMHLTFPASWTAAAVELRTT